MQWIIDLIKDWVIAYVAQETDLGANMPVGSIILWAGGFGDIPAGWRHCNGLDGTPDLRNSFILQAGGIYAPHDTGGALAHDHKFNWEHNHDLLAGGYVESGTGYDYQTSIVGVTDADTGPASSMPPYYVLAYIMKLP